RDYKVTGVQTCALPILIPSPPSSLTMPSLAILHASQLVTLAGPARARYGKELGGLGIIPDGGLLAANGRITHIGKTPEIEKLCQRDTEVVDARGCAVLPGFVDAHTHLVFAGNRLE